MGLPNMALSQEDTMKENDFIMELTEPEEPIGPDEYDYLSMAEEARTKKTEASLS